MATSCEGNNWLWDYFTSENNIARCDICSLSLEITRAPKKSNLIRHIRTQHSDDYQRIVSSGISQKDLESQLYIIQNKDIICKFCNYILNATNNFFTIRNHLEKIHKINEDKAADICEWLRKYYFDEIDTDKKRRCITCNIPILNKPLLLMDHLSKTHKTFYLESVPTGSFTSKNWVWEYFLKSEEQKAKCSVCNQHYILTRSFTNIMRHIERKHGNNFDVSENSQGNKNWPYSITENNKIKCDICDEIYDIVLCTTSYMKTHLIDAHNLNEDIARKLCNWVLEYFHISIFQTAKCSICDNMFPTSNCFHLMIHMKKAHQVRVSPEFIPARLSSELSNLFNSDRHAQDIVTSRKSQQLTCSFDQSSECDNFFDQIDESSEIRTTRLSISLSNLFNSDDSQDVVTSSESQQPIRSFNQSFDYDYFYDQNDESSEIRTTRLSSSLDNLFNSDDSQDVVTSSKSQQPIHSFNQSFDYDYFYDQNDESSEIRTTRLLSSSSRLLNSDNNTEDITALSSYQQPTCSRYRHT